MVLYLVQHGTAKTEAEDPARSLTEEGKRTVERVAEHLSTLSLALDRIEHSDKLRARQTAEIFAAKLHPAHGTVQVSGLTPNDDAELTRVRLNQETARIGVLRLSRTFRFLVHQERQDCDVSAGQRTNYYSDAPETFRGRSWMSAEWERRGRSTRSRLTGHSASSGTGQPSSGPLAGSS